MKSYLGGANAIKKRLGMIEVKKCLLLQCHLVNEARGIYWNMRFDSTYLFKG